jgi:hypothetical protein
MFPPENEMEGFYTKKEAARILGVTVRQITNYLVEGKVRKIMHRGKVYIPQEDVEVLYDSEKRSIIPTRDEFRDLVNRIEAIEQSMEIVKLGMGFGAKRPPMTDAELLLLHQRSIDLLSRPAWQTPTISELADLVMGLCEEDIKKLCLHKGTKAWSPLLETVDRMIVFIEEKPDFPEKGLGALHDRLVRAKNRFLGMIYVSSKVKRDLPSADAAALRRRLDVQPGALDAFILKYIEDKCA